MKNKLLHVLINPVSLSLCISIVIIFTLPPIFNKYNTELIEREKTGVGYTFYSDLNNDGISEELRSFEFFGNRVGVQVYSKSTLVGQWDFDGEMLEMSFPFTGDINKDNFNDIFVFTFLNDSVFVSSFNPFKNEFYIKEKPVANYVKNNESKDCIVYPCGIFDTNTDLLKEFCFSLCTPYSKAPRKIFVLDIVRDSVYSSSEGCMNIWSPFNRNYGNNGEFVFSGNFTAMATCDIDAPYSDWYTWLMVFDEEMNFKFDPIKIGFYPSELNVLPIKVNDILIFAVLNIYYGDKDHSCSISLYDIAGKKINGKEFSFSKEWYGAKLLAKGDDDVGFYIVKQNGMIEEFDNELNEISSKNLQTTISSLIDRIDIDNDKNSELIFSGKDNEQIIILKSDFDYPVLLDIAGNNTIRYCNMILNGMNEPYIYIVCDNYSYVFKYSKNPLFYIQYIVYISIFLSIYLIIFFLQRVQKHRIEEKYKTEKQIAELQLKSIKNQIDPHFILNITNSIGGLLINQDKDQIDYLIGKYGKLLRITLENSDKISTTLNIEIEYVKNYLLLEKLRLSDSFDFHIEVDKTIDINNKIPKMLIYTFVENALKHGIRHRKVGGYLNIDMKSKLSNYEITISDNGIGREKTKEFSTDCTGKGLIILDKILELYYSLEKIKIIYRINDLFDETGNAAGTEVLISIPML